VGSCGLRIRGDRLAKVDFVCGRKAFGGRNLWTGLQKIDTSSAGGELVFHGFSADRPLRMTTYCRAYARRSRRGRGERPASGPQAAGPREAGSSVRPDRCRSAANQSGIPGRDRALDPLQSPCPPHHLTRWRVKIYGRLRVGRLLTVNFRTDAAGGPESWKAGLRIWGQEFESLQARGARQISDWYC
jgi:hypothetical protein